MIIVDNINIGRKFEEANMGDCFEYEDEYFMKIPTVQFANSGNKEAVFNAVDLTSGDLSYFDGRSIVRPIKLEAKVVG